MWWPEAASGRTLGPTLALLLTALSFMPLEGLAQKTSTGDSEFIGCLDDSHKLLAGSHQIKKDTAKRSYYDCSVSFLNYKGNKSSTLVSTNTRYLLCRRLV